MVLGEIEDEMNIGFYPKPSAQSWGFSKDGTQTKFLLARGSGGGSSGGGTGSININSFCVREVEDTYVEVPNSHFPLSASEAERGTLFRSKTELRGREPC